MTLVIVETMAEHPLTDEFLQAADRRMMPCLAARDAKWRYSLLSNHRQRMICTFEAPDAEAVRAAYRHGEVTFSKIWAAQMIEPEGGLPMENQICLPGCLNVIETTYPNGFSDQAWQEASQVILPCYAERNIEWVRSYLSVDRTRVVCELNAPDAEGIREAHFRLGVPFERVWSAQRLTP